MIISEFFFSAICVLLVLLLVWFFLLADSDLALTLAQKFGRPVSDFAGKVVWITGASTGLGEAMAYELSSVGAKLVLSARSEDLLQKVQEECVDRSQGKLTKKDVLVLPFDISNLECHKQNVQNVLNHFEKIDILVNNAGRYQIGTIEAIEPEVEQNVFNVNFFGNISLTKLVLKHFLKRGKGHFVVISSIAGKFGVPASASYVATKHALQGYYESLRMEYHKNKISVTMICPGIFSSDIFSRAMSSKKDEIFQKDYSHYECNQMTSERCAHLTLVATINKLFESWIAYQPFLLMLWASQYAPDIYRYIMNAIYNKRRVEELNNGKWPKDLPVWKPMFR